jgi:hypothetical protein
MGTGGSQYLMTISPAYYMTYDKTLLSCMLLMSDSQSLANEWILGDPFLRAFTFSANMDTQSIGFIAKSGATLTKSAILSLLKSVSTALAGFVVVLVITII